MSILTSKPFILLILLISVNHALCIRCFWDYLIGELEETSNTLLKALTKDKLIEELPKENSQMSVKIAELEERLIKMEQLVDPIKKCHIDEDPSKNTYKCCIDSDVQSHRCPKKYSKSKPLVPDTEVSENIIEPTYVISNAFNFKSENNININNKRILISPPSKSINLTTYFKCIIAVLFFLLLISGLAFFFHKSMGNVLQSAINVIENITRQDEVAHNDVDNSGEESDIDQRVLAAANINNAHGFEERFDSDNIPTEDAEPNQTEWTVKKVHDHLKRIAENAKEEYPRNKYAKYLSDEFLTRIANFIVNQGCFRSFEKYLTPKSLLRHARFHHRHLNSDGFRVVEPERTYQVIINVDGNGVLTANF